MIQRNSLSVDDNINVPVPEVEHSGEGNNGCLSRNANHFQRIEQSVIR